MMYEGMYSLSIDQTIETKSYLTILNQIAY